MPDNQSIDVAKVYPGPILLLAGPGTGKTHQLARRVKFLIEEKNVTPDSITVITFTNEAAREMRQRLCDNKEQEVYVSPDKQPDHIRTIHSLGYRIINDEYRKAGLRKGYTIVSGQIRDYLLDDAARLLGFTKNEAEATELCRRLGNCVEVDDLKCQICKEYQKLLRGLNAIDFDDQILLSCRLLKQLPELQSKWQKSTNHLLVDEYQDINQAQYELIRLLCENQEDGLFVVGDDDQSIYSWRGGSPAYVINFEEHFRGAKVYSLDECRRCPPNVLNAALAIVAKDNANRLQKDKLHSKKKDNSPVIVFDVPSEIAEAKMICKAISDSSMTHDALILVPYNRFTNPIKKEMRRRRIPYDSKTDVQDSGLNSVNYLVKWLEAKNDNFSLRICLEMIINNPELKIPFGISGNIADKRENTLKKISALWPKVISDKNGLYDKLHTETENNPDIEYIIKLLEELRQIWANRKKEKPYKFIEAVTRIIRPWTSISKMSDEIQDWVEDANARDAASGDVVARLLTMARAKGLGADLVFIVGLNQYIMPPKDLDKEAFQEKQRLFYVSMTRAKKNLNLFSARTRKGGHSFLPAPNGEGVGTLQPSPFLDWLPKENTEVRRIRAKK